MLKRYVCWLGAVCAGLVLVGCGGGSDSGDSLYGGGGSGSTLGVSVTLSDSTVTSAQPATVTAQVTLGSKVIPSAVVQFSVPGGLGKLSQSSGLTDAQGRTRVTLSPTSATVGGADTVQATVTVDSATASGSTGFQLTATDSVLLSVKPAISNGDVAATPVVAYGQTVLTVSLAGVSAASPATVALSSSCVDIDKASFSPVTTTTTNNVFSVVYTDRGCAATLPSAVDTVTATLAGNGSTLQGQVYLTVPSPRSLKFISADPKSIYIKGSGQSEASTITFQVNDQAGNPLPGRKVKMWLAAYTGGLRLDGKDEAAGPVVKTTNALGQVSVIVNSGTAPVPVRVAAQLEDDDATRTVSNVLAVGIGLPDQLHFSLSQEKFNVDCYNRDGVENVYHLYVADRNGNPVAADTAINFWAEGGQIVNIRTDVGSSGIAHAQADFRCQEPRPLDGRVTIMAYAIGEESFVDLNGNNIYDVGEPFQDLGNLVKDVWFDGVFDSTRDEYFALDDGATSGVCVTSFATSYPQFAFSASVPNRPNSCDKVWSSRVYVRRAIETVMSTSGSGLAWMSPDNLSANCLTQSISNAPDNSSFVKSYPIRGANAAVYGLGGAGAVPFYVADANGNRWNPMGVGTTLAVVKASDGLTVTIGGTPVPNSTQVTHATVNYEFKDVTSGTFTMNVTSPGGLATTYSVYLTQDAPAAGYCSK